MIRLAALEASTARNSTRSSGCPRIGPASAPKTLSEISSLPSPFPSSPTPAYICSATATIRYVSRIDSTHSSAARPGRLVGVHRLLVDGQGGVPAPEGEDRPREPRDERRQASAPPGLNQSRSKEIPVGESPDLANAAMAKTSQHRELEEHQDDLDLLGRGDAAVGDPGRDRQEDQAGHDVDAAVLPQRADRLAVERRRRGTGRRTARRRRPGSTARSPWPGSPPSRPATRRRGRRPSSSR